jgi:hypothetical protein
MRASSSNLQLKTSEPQIANSFSSPHGCLLLCILFQQFGSQMVGSCIASLPTVVVQLVILSGTCCIVDSHVAQSNHLLLLWAFVLRIALEIIVSALLLVERGSSGPRRLDGCNP